jgi:hypothetical protein
MKFGLQLAVKPISAWIGQLSENQHNRRFKHERRVLKKK